MKLNIVLTSAVLLLIIILNGCETQTQQTTQPEPTKTTQPIQEETETKEEPATEAGQEITEEKPKVQEFVIEADDKGFYMNNKDVSSITADKGDEVKILFKVRKEKVYYGGLDFRGCGQKSGKVSPGGETEVSFTAEKTCTITSYWPSSGVVKDKLEVIIQ